MGLKGFFKKAFSDMKASTKAQREVDKAQFEAVKAESKANFEENRGRNTFARAKADAKKNWDDAHMTPAQRAQKAQAEMSRSLLQKPAPKLPMPVTRPPKSKQSARTVKLVSF